MATARLYQAVEFEKGSRYYRLLLQQDLFQTWLVTRIWGGKGRRAQHHRHEPYADYAQARQRFDALVTYREKHRHYHAV